jgi:O-antigen/teichoic acid export membrane protein
MTVHGPLRVTAISTLFCYVLHFLSVAVVSRLLHPEEIGVFSVASSLIAFTHILRDFGVGQYLVQLKEFTKEHVRASFTVMLLISWMIAGTIFMVRQPVSTFYQNPGLADVFAVLAINFIILPFGAPILPILKREMKFGRVAIVNVSSTVMQVTVTIATAWRGESYMSMAWGSLAGNISNVILLSLMHTRFALLMPTRRNLRNVLSFGSKSSAASMLLQLESSAPDLILGKTLGFEAVASFSRGSSLNNMILGKVNDIVSQVFFPSFSQGIRAGQSPSMMYVTAVRRVTGITVPLIACLSFFAEPLVLFFFGSQWHEAARIATILCLYRLLTEPMNFCRSALIAGGFVSTVLKCEVWVQLSFLLVFGLSAWLELRQIVYLLALPTIISLIVLYRSLHIHYDVPLPALLRAIAPSYALVPFTLVGPVALLIPVTLGAWTPSTIVQLSLSALAATVGYIVAVRTTQHPVREDLLRIAPALFLILGQAQPRSRRDSA